MPGVEGFLDQYIPASGEVALDVGANRGVWSLFLADRFERVYAVEPTPVLQVGLRCLHPRIHVLPVGAWSVAARRTFTQFAHEANTSTQDGWAGIMAGGPVGSFEADCVPVDEMAIDGRVDFIKVDVEAAEHTVILGAQKTIQHDRPRMIIEVHTAQNGAWLEMLLRSWGYTTTTVLHPYYAEGDPWREQHYWLIGEPE